MSERIGAVVNREAARIVRGLDLAALFPARNAIVALVAALGLWTATVAAKRASSAIHSAPFSVHRHRPQRIDGVDVTVTPPAYTGRPVESSHDPTRIEALAGSRVKLVVRSRASSVAIEMLAVMTRSSHLVPVRSAENSRPTRTATSRCSPPLANERGASRLIGLSVISDNPPRVRITAPAKDLFLRDAHHTIDLAIETSDDIALASLRLRYTKVSGSGERFTFTDGEVPLAVTRTMRARGRRARRGRSTISGSTRAIWSSTAPSRRTIAPARRRPNPIHTSPRFSRRAVSRRRGSRSIPTSSDTR